MARHSELVEKVKSVVPIAIGSHEEQKVILDQMGNMTKKALKGLFDALNARNPCPMCWGRKGAEKEPIKTNDDGLCINCLGEHYVVDHERFKWAFNEVMGRKLPMPKAIEMKVDDKRATRELAKVFMGMPRAEVEAMEKMFTDQIEKYSRDAIMVQAIEENGVGGGEAQA